MATWPPLRRAACPAQPKPSEPRGETIVAALAIALVFVFATRWPVARAAPLDYDEFGYLGQIAAHRFPMHHTLFQAMARILGQWAGDPYRGFILLDMTSSALALVSAWWWLRAVARPATAAVATLLLGVGPVFWGYGAMAGNYTAIVLVGSFLLGVAFRGMSSPAAWHPYAAAAVLALGTGYRPDIGVFWLPVFCVVLWRHRWKAAIASGIVFTVLNLAWIAAMLHDVGGWARYRAATAEFGYEAGAMNSVWNLGLVDGPLRYAVKIAMALVWTLGPALVFVPRGLARLRRSEHGRFSCLLLGLSAMPALIFHLLIHFGVPGYSFHYLPALIALAALGAGRQWPSTQGDRATARLIAAAAFMAAVFWFYPTNYAAPGWRGDIDLAFCRFTRTGLLLPMERAPTRWRTANSRDLARHDDTSHADARRPLSETR